MSNCLWAEIKKAMRRHPEQRILDEKRQYSYETVINYVEAWSASFASGRYAILCDNEMNTALSVLACFCAGVTAIPLSARYGKIHCERIINNSDINYIISDGTGVPKVHRVNNTSTETKDSDLPALIMYTSGTTGVPKGAMLSQKNILANLDSICDYFNISEIDCIMIARPLYHCAVLTGEFLISLLRGARIVFYSNEFHPFFWAETIYKEGVSILGGTPTLLFNLSKLMRLSKKLASIRKLVISGERLTKTIAEIVRSAFPDAEIYSVYGLTEASPRISALPPEMFDDCSDSCGFPIKGVRIRIVKDDGVEARPNEIGDLFVQGDNVMMGYYKNEKATKAAFSEGWLRTGDLAYRDKKGLLYIKGRRDDMIIHAGINVYPQEIETVLMRNSEVTGVLVYGTKDLHCGQKIMMLVAGENLSVEKIRKYCEENLPAYEQPAEIKIVDKIHQNGSGKIIRAIN